MRKNLYKNTLFYALKYTLNNEPIKKHDPFKMYQTKPNIPNISDSWALSPCLIKYSNELCGGCRGAFGTAQLVSRIGHLQNVFPRPKPTDLPERSTNSAQIPQKLHKTGKNYGKRIKDYTKNVKLMPR